MVTSLIAGEVTPLWDRRLVNAIKQATWGMPDEPVASSFGVMNDHDVIYRYVTAHGEAQYNRVLDCLCDLGFEFLEGGDRHLVRRRT